MRLLLLLTISLVSSAVEYMPIKDNQFQIQGVVIEDPPLSQLHRAKRQFQQPLYRQNPSPSYLERPPTSSFSQNPPSSYLERPPAPSFSQNALPQTAPNPAFQNYRRPLPATPNQQPFVRAPSPQVQPQFQQFPFQGGPQPQFQQSTVQVGPQPQFQQSTVQAGPQPQFQQSRLQVGPQPQYQQSPLQGGPQSQPQQYALRPNSQQYALQPNSQQYVLQPNSQSQQAWNAQNYVQPQSWTPKQRVFNDGDSFGHDQSKFQHNPEWAKQGGTENDQYNGARYYYPPKQPYPLPKCFHNPTGYVCCNQHLNDLITETYLELEKRPKFHTCNVNALAYQIQFRAEKVFNHTFETIAAYEDFAQKIHFRGDMVCKVEMGGKYMLAYATVREVMDNTLRPLPPRTSVEGAISSKVIEEALSSKNIEGAPPSKSVETLLPSRRTYIMVI